MRSTSAAFDPFANERDVDCEIQFELLDENAQPNAVPSANEQEGVSQLSQLTDDVRTTAKYATLEPDSWALDGSFIILPDTISEAQTGWWSVMSGADGTFTTTPTLTFTFGGVAISSIGFTLYFDDAAGIPTSIRITAYAADMTTVLDQQTFANSAALFVADMAVQNYYKVTFEFLATSPVQRRVRVTECLFGVVQLFNRDNLESVSLTYAADTISEALASRQLTFVFNNSDHKYNLVNPNGLYAYLQEGQDILVSVAIDGEIVSMGSFEFTSATASDDEITGKIVGNDYILSALDEPTIAGANTTTTLSAAVAAVLTGLSVTVSLEYPTASVVVAYPQDTTKREALRLLAQATCCAVWVDRDGVLQMHPLTVATTANDELTADRMPSMGGISVSEPVDSVVLTVRNEYYLDIDDNYYTHEDTYTSGTGKRVKTVDNPCVLPANGQTVADWLLAEYNRRVKYDKPNRCNPAVEIGDTLTIYDAYGENRAAVVTEISISFGSDGLSARTKAAGNGGI